MTDDLTRARQHLSEAERLLDGDVERAVAHASIAKGLVALHAGEHLDRMAAPIRPTVARPSREDSAGAAQQARDARLAWEAEFEARRARERQARLAMVDAVLLDGGVVVHPGDPGMPGYDAKDDRAVWSPEEQVFDDPTPGPARGAGGIFGQMEERPNALEDQGEH